jgi:hypothetical protein
MRLPLFLSVACMLVPAAAGAQVMRIAPQAMSGTWQIMTVKNLTTGEVDSIAKRRTMWTQYTNARWTYIWTDVSRRAATQYAWVWNGPSQVFWASGGEYWMPDAAHDMFYTNVLSISPWQLQIGSVEHVVSVSPTSYIYRSEPDAKGVVNEYTHRRIDGAHDRWPMLPVGGIHPEALQGLWQLMTVKNVRTGQVDDIARRQTIWMHATDSVMMHVWQDKERPVVTPDSLAKLAPDARAEANRAMFVDATGNLRFGAVAGTYSVVGDTVILQRKIAIDPALEGTTARDPVVRLDRDWYIIRLTAPDGAVRELAYRRLD